MRCTYAEWHPVQSTTLIVDRCGRTAKDGAVRSDGEESGDEEGEFEHFGFVIELLGRGLVESLFVESLLLLYCCKAGVGGRKDGHETI